MAECKHRVAAEALAADLRDVIASVRDCCLDTERAYRDASEADEYRRGQVSQAATIREFMMRQARDLLTRYAELLAAHAKLKAKGGGAG